VSATTDATDILGVMAKLNRTIDAMQQQIDQLTAEVQRLTPPSEEPSWPTPSAS
jgi:prefoldin subunit 5